VQKRSSDEFGGSPQLSRNGLNPFESDGGSFELREVTLQGSPKPALNQTSNGYYLHAQEARDESNFDLHLDDDPLHMHFDREREEDEEKEEDGNDDFEVITIEEGALPNIFLPLLVLFLFI
jgi:hypothetical protein